MSSILKLFTACLFLNLLIACGGQSKLTQEDLNGTFWSLTSMPGDLPDGVEINLQFEPNRITGAGVCNRYFSEYSLEGNRISFKAIGATEMMCMEHSDVEVKYFQTLDKAETVELAGDQLTIHTPDGTLIFSAASPPSES